jgi:hypothetical protein
VKRELGFEGIKGGREEKKGLFGFWEILEIAIARERRD